MVKVGYAATQRVLEGWAEGGFSYADAFCVATAMHLNAPIWTGDPEIIARSGGPEAVDLR